MDAWARSAQGWPAGLHGDWLVASVLHPDGAAPHIQGLCIPSDDGTWLSLTTLFDPSALRAARKGCASALRDVGVERGIAASKAGSLHAPDDDAVPEAKRSPAIAVADCARLSPDGLPTSFRGLQAVADHARILDMTVQDQKRTIAIVAAERGRALRARDAAQRADPRSDAEAPAWGKRMP